MQLPGFKLSLAAAAVISVIGLSGCFDKKSDSSESNAQLSGVVSKGIIVGGNVTAYPIINGVIDKTAELGTATTGTDGKYVIAISGYKGPVAVVVSPAADDTSKVKCDVPDGCTVDETSYDFGSLMPLNYAMEAIVPDVTSGSKISASVTPLTHMAAAYAKDIGLTADTIKLANEKVAKLLDVEDILSVAPVDVTDPKAVGSTATSVASLKYGYIAASIAAIANEENSGDVGATINNLAQSYVEKNGELVGNESTDDTKVISLAEITSGATLIMEAETDVTGGVFALVKKEVTDQDTAAKDTTQTDAVTSTTTTTVVAADNVVVAKEIVTELRTWATMLQEDMKSGSEGLMNKAELAIDASSVDLEQVQVGMVASLAAMVDAYKQHHAGVISGGSYAISDYIPADFIIKSDNTPIVGIGTIVVTGNQVSLTDATVNGATINLSMTAPASVSGTEFTVSLGASRAENDNIEWTFDASSATITFAESVADIYAVNDSNKVTKVTLSLGSSIGHKASSTAANKLKYNGSVDAIVLVNYATWANGKAIESVNPEKLNMDGQFSLDGNTFSAKLEVNMKNAATFNRVEPEYLEGQTYPNFGSYEFSADGKTLIIHWPDSDTSFVYDSETQIVTETLKYHDGTSGAVLSYEFPAYTSLDDFFATWEYSIVSGYYYRDIGYFDLTAPETWSKEGGNVSATMIWSYDDKDEDSDHWRDLDGTLTMTVGFENLPEATIVANIDRSGFAAGTGSLTMSYDDVTIVVSGNLDAADEEDPKVDGSVVITTAKGKLEIYPDMTIGGIRGSVKVNGQVVGSIKPSKLDKKQLIITYINGDFETVVF